MSIWFVKNGDLDPFIKAAELGLQTDPNNPAALFIIVSYALEHDPKQRLKWAKRLVESSIPEYHSILGASYAPFEMGHLGLRSLDKAIKLRPLPTILYLKAIFLQNVVLAADNIVIEAFHPFHLMTNMFQNLTIKLASDTGQSERTF